MARGILDGLEVDKYINANAFCDSFTSLPVYNSVRGIFGESFTYFSPTSSKITPEVMLEALGQAFFTLSLGMGAIMAYGAYMPANQNIGKTAISVAALDTGVALLAGIAIFPIVLQMAWLLQKGLVLFLLHYLLRLVLCL